MKLFDAIQKADAARKPRSLRDIQQDAMAKPRPKGDTIQAISKAADARKVAEDIKDFGPLGKPFLIQLHADVEKAVEETRILWGLKSRAEVIRLLIGKGLGTLII